MATPIRQAQGKQKKIDQVKELTTKLEKAKALVITDYTGLTHKQLEELRRTLKKTQAELTISKNTLLKRALLDVKKSISDTHLQGATATLFAYADEVAPLKALIKFFKDATHGTVRAGLLGATELSAAEVERLSTLPSREQLLSQLVGQLKAPLYGLHNALSWNIRKLVYSLNVIKEKKV